MATATAPPHASRGNQDRGRAGSAATAFCDPRGLVIPEQRGRFGNVTEFELARRLGERSHVGATLRTLVEMHPAVGRQCAVQRVDAFGRAQVRRHTSPPRMRRRFRSA